MTNSRDQHEQGLGFRHPRIQKLRRLVNNRQERDEARSFVAEGFKLLEEALNAGITPSSVFVAPNTQHAVTERAYAAGIAIHEVERGVIERVGDTATPQGVLSILPQFDRPLGALDEPMIVMVDIRDPGNAGTILRSAEAAGISSVVMTKGCVDIYNPKTVRASAGALFHVPFVTGVDTNEVLAHLEHQGVTAIGTAMDADADYDSVNLRTPVAIFVGNEANGLDPELLAHLDQSIAIPIAGRSESLNVSMAASVIAFELARQRRNIA